jgi:cell division protein FtsZ
MIEYDRKQQNQLAEKTALKICVAGVGGAGSNVLDRITMDRSVDADLACFHTDIRVLNHGMASHKVQLGGDLMKGIGAGGDPDLGREAALFSKEQIRQTLQGHEIVFICTGLGGGTGSGAAPVVAEIAKGLGALVVVLATMPFSFEGRRRHNQAEEALELLQKRADALILFDNNRMGELVLPKEGIQKAFTLADQTIAQCARAVSVMVSTPGLVKLGLDDLVSALSASNGRCLFGFGEAKGANRGSDALKKALKSPLIDSGRLLQETKNLLAHVVGGESLTLMEVDAIMKQLGRSVPDDTQILFGLAVDPKLGDSLSVTLISSLGLDQMNRRPVASEEAAIAPAPVFKPVAEVKKTPEVKKAPPLPTPVPATAVEPEPLELFIAPPPPPAPETPAPAVEEIEPVSSQELELEESVEEIEAIQEPEIQKKEEVESPFAFADQTPIITPIAQTAKVIAPIRNRQPEAAPEVARSVLAAVLANPAAAAVHESPVDHVIEEELMEEPLNSGARSSAPVLVGAGAGAAARGEQQTFRLGDEDRGRFKDTEPSISDGEDLDVPTWMRMRKKAKG